MPAAQGTLTLHLKNAFDLIAKDEARSGKEAKSDPYAMVTLPFCSAQKSRVLNQTLHPVWDQKFTVTGRTVAELVAAGPIKIEIYDKDTFGSETMGVLELNGDSYKMLQLNEPLNYKNSTLKDVPHGKITFDLLFEADSPTA